MFMKCLPFPEIWFGYGSQHLYGQGALKTVAANADSQCGGLVVWMPPFFPSKMRIR